MREEAWGSDLNPEIHSHVTWGRHTWMTPHTVRFDVREPHPTPSLHWWVFRWCIRLVVLKLAVFFYSPDICSTFCILQARFCSSETVKTATPAMPRPAAVASLLEVISFTLHKSVILHTSALSGHSVISPTDCPLKTTNEGIRSKLKKLMFV